MDKFLVFFAAICTYIAVFFAAQLIWFRLRRVKELILTFTAIAFLSGAAVWIPFYFLTADFFPDDVIRGLISFGGLYGSLGFSGTYIILGPISADRSLSAHICIHMLRAGGKMPKEELLRRYNPNLIFDKRFQEYLDVGVMSREGGDFRLNPKGRRVAYIFMTFLKALKMKENF